jgi:hypothetical protein
MILVVLALASAPPDASQALAHCRLSARGSNWVGGCGAIFDETPVFTLAPTEKVKSGIWRSDAAPQHVFSGKLSSSGDPDYPVELEIYPSGSGIIRTEYGWHEVSNFKSSASTMDFDMDAANELAPNALDLKIIERAASILKQPNAWNRADNRQCPPNAHSYSLYCAIEEASIEVTGGFNHRRPAAELVRTIVEDHTKGRSYHHRLMDFNNDPTTTLADVEAILTEADSEAQRSLT